MRHIKRYTQLFENQQELSQEQRDWLNKCTDGSWVLNPKTGLVDVSGRFYCYGKNLDSFKGVRFGHISGDFDCARNRLTSLEGAPQSVNGRFDCTSNRLTSLEGAPQRVGGDFYCHNNSLTSLEGAPQRVGGDFACSDNPLTSLKGAPQSVDGHFYCEDTSLTSLEGAPQKVGGYVHCTGNPIPISQETIRRVLKRMSDKEITLEQAVKGCWRYIPEEDRLYLAKHHPGLSQDEKRGYAALLKFKGKII